MDDARSSGLKPAEVEPGALRKLRFLTGMLCVVEVWALLFGSGVLYWLGLVHNAALLVGLGFGCVGGIAVTGHSIETWLAILSREPLLNDKDEIDSNAPTQRSVAYVFPPLAAAFGVFGIVAHTAIIPLLTSGISLAIFAYLMRRIWRVRRQYLRAQGAES